MRRPSVIAAGLAVAVLAFGCKSEETSGVQDQDSASSTEVTEPVASEASSDPANLDAEITLADALAKAKTEDKNVFVHVGNSWSDHCILLEEFLTSNQDLLTQDFVVIRIDTDKMKFGVDVANRLKDDLDVFEPWMVILDQDGQALVNSVAPEGNIGVPLDPWKVDHFMKMVDLTARHSPPETRTKLREALVAFGAPYQEPPAE